MLYIKRKLYEVSISVWSESQALGNFKRLRARRFSEPESLVLAGFLRYRQGVSAVLAAQRIAFCQVS